MRDKERGLCLSGDGSEARTLKGDGLSSQRRAVDGEDAHPNAAALAEDHRQESLLVFGETQHIQLLRETSLLHDDRNHLKRRRLTRSRDGEKKRNWKI